MPANSLSLIRIVDDDAEMRESLEFLLSTEGWKSRSYASAEAFLETDDVMVPGCLILDIRMPGLSGLQLQELLKKKDYSLPILFITAHGDITMAVEAVKNGAFDFLPKPLDGQYPLPKGRGLKEPLLTSLSAPLSRGATLVGNV